jgi:hypothetical protein
MTLNLDQAETAITHFTDAFSSILKGIIHTAHILAPIVSTVAQASGNDSVAKVADTVANVSEKLDT